MKDHVNVTLSLPEALMREFRVFAAKKNQSMTAIMAEAIRERMEREGTDEETRLAKQRVLERLKKGYNLGTKGQIQWTREELHDRIR